MFSYRVIAAITRSNGFASRFHDSLPIRHASGRKERRRVCLALKRRSFVRIRTIAIRKRTDKRKGDSCFLIKRERERGGYFFEGEDKFLRCDYDESRKPNGGRKFRKFLTWCSSIDRLKTRAFFYQRAGANDVKAKSSLEQERRKCDENDHKPAI